MRRRLGHRLLVGTALAVAVAGASVTLVLFNRAGSPGSGSAESATASSTDDTASTSTSSTTTSTMPPTTTTVPAPAAVAAPAPAPAASPAAAPVPASVPAPAPAPPPPPPAPQCSGGGGGVAGGVLAAMNSDRGGGLCWNNQLAGFAQGWAQTMAADQSLTHQNLSGVIGSTPFHTMGENILVGPAGMSVAQMENAWMNSSPHRANILNGAFHAAGVGAAYDSQGQVWVCVDFGG
jgi:uncharacterized protein YkwD